MTLPGIGPKTAAKLAKLAINSSQDLLFHFPHRYLDFSHSSAISLTVINQNATITGKLMTFNNIFTRSHKNIQKATVSDRSGTINLIWFNQPYLLKMLKTGEIYSFAGQITLYQNQKTIISPEFGQYNTGKIIAVYPETKGLSSKWFRSTIQKNLIQLLSGLVDPLPPSILRHHHLLPLTQALTQIHCPSNLRLLQSARLRLSINEILSLQAQSFLQHRSWASLQPQYTFTDNPKINKLINTLPFKLTPSQQKVWQEIKTDLTNPIKITNRLLQGDVGSGKTIVALLACYLAHLSNYRSIVVAPTEILARQHYLTFKKILPKTVKIHLLTASQHLTKLSPKAIIIATHAAFYHQKELVKNLGLLVVDEQHKFGVQQRSTLTSTATPPHSITMTATPIPRTISLTMLGNLELSTLDHLPQHRFPIKTFLVPNSKQADCYRWIANQIQSTSCQAYFVCPFIENSETLASVKSATAEYEKLVNIFPSLNLALIHGRLKSTQREKIINKFINNKINILVTTPIIEVGIDIPNATIMLVQSADRFGLASLHQLRGRVGRGRDQSYCYLFTDSDNAKAISRLNFVTRHANGLDISEYDLATRGPGEAFALAQHGFPSLKIASLSNLQLIKLCHQILAKLVDDNFSIENLVDSRLNLTSLPISTN